MNSRITRREVAKQFIIAIELLLEWIEQKENSTGESTGEDVREESIETRLLTAPDVARILNISKGAAYQLIQQGKLPCIRINRNVRVRPEDLDEFISQNLG
jgi:excisionase family DNA binding protein